ncbi:hypothetical protein F4604DRAFT_1929708 [Suillus subluteus]|nr:hypothetical protein F4604DRAFT_1929708 [Suillus subluteus]
MTASSGSGLSSPGPAVPRRKPVISALACQIFLSSAAKTATLIHYLHKILPSSSCTDATPLMNTEISDRLDFPATLSLLTNCSPTHGRSHTDPRENSRLPTHQSSATAPTTFKACLHHLWTACALPPIFNHNDADDDLIRDEDYVPHPSN